MDKNTQGNILVTNYKTMRMDKHRYIRRRLGKQINFRKSEEISFQIFQYLRFLYLLWNTETTYTNICTFAT